MSLDYSVTPVDPVHEISLTYNNDIPVTDVEFTDDFRIAYRPVLSSVEGESTVFILDQSENPQQWINVEALQHGNPSSHIFRFNGRLMPLGRRKVVPGTNSQQFTLFTINTNGELYEVVINENPDNQYVGFSSSYANLNGLGGVNTVTQIPSKEEGIWSGFKLLTTTNSRSYLFFKLNTTIGNSTPYLLDLPNEYDVVKATTDSANSDFLVLYITYNTVQDNRVYIYKVNPGTTHEIERYDLPNNQSIIDFDVDDDRIFTVTQNYYLKFSKGETPQPILPADGVLGPLKSTFNFTTEQNPTNNGYRSSNTLLDSAVHSFTDQEKLTVMDSNVFIYTPDPKKYDIYDMKEMRLNSFEPVVNPKIQRVSATESRIISTRSFPRLSTWAYTPKAPISHPTQPYHISAADKAFQSGQLLISKML